MSRVALLLLCALHLGILVKETTSIIGERPLSPNEWPWLVTLNYAGHNDYKIHQGLDHECGGVLIHRQWVLSAAHCFDCKYGATYDDNGTVLASTARWEPRLWTAVLGEHHLRQQEGTEQTIEVQQIFMHPEYTFNSTGLIRDIALLQLREPVILSEAVKPIEIDRRRSVGRGPVACRTAGWGWHSIDRDEDGTMAPHMATVKQIGFATCRDINMRLFPYFSPIDNTYMCFTDPHQDACLGDDGNPLVCKNNRNNKTLLSGITSLPGCGHPKEQTIYSRVNRFLSWIKQTVKDNTVGIECNLPGFGPYPLEVCEEAMNTTDTMNTTYEASTQSGDEHS